MTKNFSVVIPVLNEAESIDSLLDSLSTQTLLPLEVIMVDGGSTDGTVDKIRDWQQQHQLLKITILVKPQTNRTQARNIGMAEAQNSLMALTDAGCRPKTDWLEKIIQPFFTDDKVQVVAGFYDPAPENSWQNLLADYTCTRDWNFNSQAFLPSSRSLALTQQIWQQVGGYPEELNTCEDLIFAEKLKKAAKSEGWRVVKDAQVIWDQPKTLSQLADKVYHYALGDLQAGYERHVAKINAAKWRIIVLLCFAFPVLLAGSQYVRMVGKGLFLLYIFGSLFKRSRHLIDPLNWFLIPLVQLTVDAALVQALISHYLKSLTPGIR